MRSVFLITSVRFGKHSLKLSDGGAGLDSVKKEGLIKLLSCEFSLKDRNLNADII